MAQYAKTAEVRRGIVDACLTTFGESGFHGASMAEIARRAGISHTGLLHHFPHKEDLLTAVLDLQDQRSAEYLAAHAALADDDADPLDILQGLATALTERDSRVGLLELSTVLTGEATTVGHPAHDYFRDRYRNIRSFITRRFDRLRDDGRLSSTFPPAVLASMLIALVDGLHTQWLFDRDSVDVQQTVQAFLATIVSPSDDVPVSDAMQR